MNYKMSHSRRNYVYNSTTYYDLRDTLRLKTLIDYIDYNIYYATYYMFLENKILGFDRLQ